MRRVSIPSLFAMAQITLLAACGTEPTERVVAPTELRPTFHRDADGSDNDDREDPGPTFSEWSEPVHLGAVVNSSSRELGPELSPDGLSLYFGSDRPGGVGGFDLWVSRRACRDCPWQPPINLGPNINSSGPDGAPGLSPDGRLLFFSGSRSGGHGGEDIWLSRRRNTRDDLGWQPAINLGPVVNTAEHERGPMYLRGRGGRHTLYFVRLGDIYQVTMTRGGEAVGAVTPVAELNYPGVIDNDPAVRRDGKELVFWSGRPGQGGADLWVATRRSVRDPWATPVNLGPRINTPGADLTPSLSLDGRTLVFSVGMEARPSLGFQDIWVSTRMRLDRDDADSR